jgi:release factor glutamine methyltransferase
MSQTDTWTIGRLLTWTSDYFKTHGSKTPRLDAELLLAHARGCNRIDLYTAFAEEAGEETRAAFRDLVRRRAAGTPVAYLLGCREFYSLSFHVTPDVLIPRPETEFVVVELLDRAADQPGNGKAWRIADVGTGSGILAVCAAKHLPGCHVMAVDTSGKALKVARRNAAEHAVAERIDFVKSDLLDGLDRSHDFDFIVSNPPYVSQSELAQLARDVRDHEPHTALVAGPTGTEIIRRLIPQAAGRLVNGGWLIMEISPMIEKSVLELLANDGRFAQTRTIKDLAQRTRVISAQRTGEASGRRESNRE